MIIEFFPRQLREGFLLERRQLLQLQSFMLIKFSHSSILLNLSNESVRRALNLFGVDFCLVEELCLLCHRNSLEGS